MAAAATAGTTAAAAAGRVSCTPAMVPGGMDGVTAAAVAAVSTAAVATTVAAVTGARGMVSGTPARAGQWLPVLQRGLLEEGRLQLRAAASLKSLEPPTSFYSVRND